MERSTSTEIIQNHSGSGDNVGSKYYQVFQALTPQHLVRQVGMVFSSIREKDTAKAATQIEIIQNAENLDDRARSILQILSIHLGLTDAAASVEAYPVLIKFLSTAQLEIETDICLAALLRLDLKNGKIQDAIDRYNQSPSVGEYSKEVFYELIADSSTLESEYEKAKLYMSEGEFNGIIRGAVRVTNQRLLSTATRRLSDTYPSYNSQVFSLISDTYSLNPILCESQSLYTTKSVKDAIDSILEKTEKLISKSRGADARLFDIAVSLLQYIGWQSSNLQDACWSFVTELEKNHPEYASRLYIAYNKDFSHAPTFIKKLADAKYSAHSRKELADSIINSETIGSDDLPVLFEILQPKEIRQWLKNGGKLAITDKVELDFVELLLQSCAISNTEDRLAIEELRNLSKKFIDSHGQSIKYINQHLMIQLCENLYSLNLSSTCCNILTFILPKQDLWLSPGVDIYLRALLTSHQILTLESVLSNLDKNEWNASTWQIKTMSQEQAGDIPAALSSAEEMVAKAPESLTACSYYAHLVKKNGGTDQEISKIFEKIPDRALSNYSTEALRALVLIANYQDFKRAERILIEWFSDNPSKCAIGLTNFHFSLLHREHLDTSPQVGNYIGGYKYSKEGEEFTRLIAKNKTNENPYVLDSESPIAKLLSEMSVGDSAAHSMQDLILLEKLDPYTTIFRLCLEIRNKDNDGSDVFSVMHAPEDPSELVSMLERKFGKSKAEKESSYDILASSELPMLFKGHHLNSTSPIKAAIEQLTDKDSLKGDLPNIGIANPANALLDPYTACYLALTGLAYKIPEHLTKFKITPETRASITGWLVEVTDSKYMTIGMNDQGQLFRTTSEDITNNYRQLLDGLQIILDCCDTEYPKVFDLPDQIIQLTRFFDSSTFSTIRTSIANDIPWLCIDDKIAAMHNSLNYKLMSTYSTCTELGMRTTYEQKAQGLFLYAINAIPYALTYRDLHITAFERKPEADITLSLILKKIKLAISSNPRSVEEIHRTLFALAFKGYDLKILQKGTITYDPTQSRYFENAFNACLEVIITSFPQHTAEQKIAKALFEFYKLSATLIELHKFFAHFIALFARGHFLKIEFINAHLFKLAEQNLPKQTA
jgi:hypothetical protein